MSFPGWLLVGVAAALLLYALFAGVLLALGRRRDARALGGLIPDCLVPFARLLRDPRLSRRDKAPLALFMGYLAVPFDLVPDVIPVAGQLDDVILAAWVLRRLVRRAGAELVASHWPGPEASLAVLLRLAGSAPARGAL